MFDADVSDGRRLRLAGMYEGKDQQKISGLGRLKTRKKNQALRLRLKKSKNVNHTRLRGQIHLS